jgi:hypothetical protein
MIEDEKTVGILFGNERIGAATVEGYTDGEDEGFTVSPDADLAARIAAVEDPVIRALAGIQIPFVSEVLGISAAPQGERAATGVMSAPLPVPAGEAL